MSSLIGCALSEKNKMAALSMQKEVGTKEVCPTALTLRIAKELLALAKTFKKLKN